MEITEDGAQVVVNTQESVEHHVMHNNAARFRLTNPTPPMQEPMRSELGFFGATAVAKEILEGTYECPAEVDDYTRYFIASLRRSTNYNILDDSISREDFVSYWKGSKESTSSSVSGLHFGHYKAAAQDPYLAEVHALTSELAYSTGYWLFDPLAGRSLGHAGKDCGSYSGRQTPCHRPTHGSGL